jgi:hypothetical protein
VGVAAGPEGVELECGWCGSLVSEREVAPCDSCWDSCCEHCVVDGTDGRVICGACMEGGYAGEEERAACEEAAD